LKVLTFNLPTFQPSTLKNLQPATLWYDDQESNPDVLPSGTTAKSGAGAASVHYLPVSLDVLGLDSEGVQSGREFGTPF
jgi:hypothetical protein